MAGRLLDGVRVLDISIWRPMPHATQILCDLGAEVLKVEPPGGDPMRSFPELFASVARGKRSIELDLKTPAGRRRIGELVSEADVFCEAFRPGVAERLGLGADTLRRARPGLIYCSISGYGQLGPWRDVPGHDLNYQALAGALRRTGDGAAPPSIPRLPAADLEAGTLAALLVCAALARRLQTGEGERIDVAMADVMAWWVGPRSGTAVAPAGAGHGEAGARAGGWPGYGVFRTADDRYLTLAPLTEAHLWSAICTALDLGDLAALPIYERLDRAPEIDERVAGAIRRLRLADALDRLRAAGAPVAPVLTPEEAARHEHFAARGMLARAGPHEVAALPARLDTHPCGGDAAVPAVGEHDGFAQAR